MNIKTKINLVALTWDTLSNPSINGPYESLENARIAARFPPNNLRHRQLGTPCNHAHSPFAILGWHRDEKPVMSSRRLVPSESTQSMELVIHGAFPVYPFTCPPHALKSLGSLLTLL